MAKILRFDGLRGQCISPADTSRLHFSDLRVYCICCDQFLNIVSDRPWFDSFLFVCICSVAAIGLLCCVICLCQPHMYSCLTCKQPMSALLSPSPLQFEATQPDQCCQPVYSETDKIYFQLPSRNSANNLWDALRHSHRTFHSQALSFLLVLHNFECFLMLCSQHQPTQPCGIAVENKNNNKNI